MWYMRRKERRSNWRDSKAVDIATHIWRRLLGRNRRKIYDWTQECPELKEHSHVRRLTISSSYDHSSTDPRSPKHPPYA